MSKILKQTTNFDRFLREYINQYIHRCERRRVGNVLIGWSNTFNFKSIDIPFIYFSDLNSYSTEISSQNKHFIKYIVKKEATKGS